MLKFGIFFALLTLLVFIGYQTLGALWNPSIITKKSEAFLHQVHMQKFDTAEKLFDDSVGIQDWAGAMRDLHEEQNFRLLNYDSVKPEFDDGSFSTGHANIIFEIDGETVSTEAILTFGFGGKPKQVCAITPPGIKPDELPQLQEWNRIMCGGSF